MTRSSPVTRDSVVPVATTRLDRSSPAERGRAIAASLGSWPGSGGAPGALALHR